MNDNETYRALCADRLTRLRELGSRYRLEAAKINAEYRLAKATLDPDVARKSDSDLVKMISETIGTTLAENKTLAVRCPAVDDLDEDHPVPVSINVEGTFFLGDLAAAVLNKLRAVGVIR